MLVAVGGLSGTGKSVLARALAPDIGPAPGAVVLRSDVLRKQQFGVPESEPLPESAYRQEITDEIYQQLRQRAGRVLAQGHAVVVDAVFARPDEREAIEAAARRLGCRFVGLFLKADLASRLRRVGRRHGDASDATPDIAGRQEHYDIGALNWTLVDASGSPEQTVRKSLAAMGPGGA
jgi:predicted kinase